MTGSAQTKGNKPIAEYKVGASKITVWENKGLDGTTWKNFKVEKVYKKGEEWKTSNSFDEAELFQLKEVIEKAIAGEGLQKEED